MPKYRIVGKTAPPPAKHRVTGKTNAFLTDYPPPPPVRRRLATKTKAAHTDYGPPKAKAAAPIASVGNKVTRVCKITIEHPGEPPKVYLTRSSHETLP